MATPSSPPKAFNTIWECLDGKDKHQLIKALFYKYSKNQIVNLGSNPEPRESIPTGKKLLTSLLAPKIKPKGNDLYQFVLWMCVCANGSNQEGGIDVDHS